MQFKFGKQLEDGRIEFTGSFSEEEANFMATAGIATIFQLGSATYVAMNAQMQEEAAQQEFDFDFAEDTPVQ